MVDDSRFPLSRQRRESQISEVPAVPRISPARSQNKPIRSGGDAHIKAARQGVAKSRRPETHGAPSPANEVNASCFPGCESEVEFSGATRTGSLGAIAFILCPLIAFFDGFRPAL